MIIDNVYVYTPDKTFIKGGIVVDGVYIQDVYTEKNVPKSDDERIDGKLCNPGTDRSSFSWV